MDEVTWRPTPDDVAKVCPAYTRGPVDSDGESSGAQQGVFTDETEPSIDEVQGLIENGMREVVGRTPLTAVGLNDYADLAKQTVIWHAAASIEAEKASEQAMDADGPAKWKQASYVACLNDLIAAIPVALRLV